MKKTSDLSSGRRPPCPNLRSFRCEPRILIEIRSSENTDFAVKWCSYWRRNPDTILKTTRDTASRRIPTPCSTDTTCKIHRDGHDHHHQKQAQLQYKRHQGGWPHILECTHAMRVSTMSSGACDGVAALVGHAACPLRLAAASHSHASDAGVNAGVGRRVQSAPLP